VEKNYNLLFLFYVARAVAAIDGSYCLASFDWFPIREANYLHRVSRMRETSRAS